MQGKITNVIAPKGYFFVKQKDGPSRFAHFRDWMGNGEPNRNQFVEFDSIENPRGPAAVNVRPVNQDQTGSQPVKFGEAAPEEVA